jgi:hypothetical protein
MTLAAGKVKIYRLTMIDPEFGDVLPLDFLLVTPDLEPVPGFPIRVFFSVVNPPVCFV